MATSREVSAPLRTDVVKASVPLDISEFCAAELYGRRCFVEKESYMPLGAVIVWTSVANVEPSERLSFARYTALRASGIQELSLS